MKIGLICDSHMPPNSDSAQRSFCLRAAEMFKNDGIKTVITLGDITAFGEVAALSDYLDMFSSFEHFAVCGNSDVRNPDTAQSLIERCPGFEFLSDGIRILGINSSYARIEKEDREKLMTLNDGDVVVLHHPPERMEAESREFFEKLMAEKSLTVLYGHLHRKLISERGKSKLFGIRAIDPDKSFGDFPCVTYYDTETGEREEKLITVSTDAIFNLREHFGISCVDNHRDVEYATENKLFGVELRCNGKGWEPDLSLIPKLDAWRKAGGKYLSVHMPNLYWQEGSLIGEETWMKATQYANDVGADGLTIHPPRIKLCDMKEAHDKLLELYVYVVKNVGKNVKIGIENLHTHRGETDTPERCFGYVPSEVSAWIDEINAAIGEKDRVGHTLDVGHARNNAPFANVYPVSRWYEQMGKRTVAYHIHQVVQKEEGLKNHNPIENWFGPQISYASFFLHWQNETINRRPVFLEVKGAENFEKSIKAFEKAFK